ncbi:hypothetical protein GEMRC1_012307 [Eukaryota sp. GEM-RC1]
MNCLLVLFVSLLVLSNAKLIMPWMGLERTHEDIKGDLEQIRRLRYILSDVSFEEYDLDWNAHIIRNDFYPVNDIIADLKLGRQPMITTVNIAKLTQLFESTESMDQFINEAVQLALKFNYTGFNIDFEPSGREAFPLAPGLVQFVDRFAKALHRHNKILSLDLAQWTQFFNYEELAKTSVDFFAEMSTYAGNFESFKKAFHKSLDIFGDRLCVGLMHINPNTGKPYSDEEIKARFDYIMQFDEPMGICIWMMPVPENWIPHLAKWRQL